MLFQGVDPCYYKGGHMVFFNTVYKHFQDYQDTLCGAWNPLYIFL